MGGMRNEFKILVGKPDAKRTFGRSGRRWDDNIKMALSQIRWEGTDWIQLVQDRDQWQVLMNSDSGISRTAERLLRLVFAVCILLSLAKCAHVSLTFIQCCESIPRQYLTKGKYIKLFLCLIKRHATKTYGGVEI
jgi:hypothetical protein